MCAHLSPGKLPDLATHPLAQGDLPECPGMAQVPLPLAIHHGSQLLPEPPCEPQTPQDSLSAHAETVNYGCPPATLLCPRPPALPSHSCSNLLQGFFVDGVAKLHFAVQGVLFIVADEVNEAVKLGVAQHHSLAFLLDSAVLDLPLSPSP